MMATAMKNSDQHRVRKFHTGNNEYDDLSLVWLDTQLNSSADCLHTKERLRLIVNVLKTFTDINTCLAYIQSRDDDDEPICVIVSGALSSTFIPAVIDRSQIACVAIYCFDEVRYQGGFDINSSQSAKITGIFVELDPLLDALNKRVTMLRDSMSSVSSFAFNKLEDQRQKSVKDLSQENAYFIWFQLLIQILFRLPRTDAVREKMIQDCERQYDENEAQLIKIKEFGKKYQPKDVVSWYTRDSFVYRIIHKILDERDSLRIMFEKTAAFVWQRVETGVCKGVSMGVK
jgi:hypothetical protein